MDPSLHLSQPTLPVTADEQALLVHTLYHPLVRSLMYLAVRTRPNITYTVHQLYWYLNCFCTVHWEVAKQVIQYLKGSHDLVLMLGGDHPACLIGHTGSNFTVCVDTCHSVSGFCFSLGLRAITWCLHQLHSPSLSSCEAELISASEAMQEILWLCSLLTAIGFSPLTATPLLCDNQSAIALTEDPVFHSCMCHVEMKYLHIHHHVCFSCIKLLDICSSSNIANIFTKALPCPSFVSICDHLGLQLFLLQRSHSCHIVGERWSIQHDLTPYSILWYSNILYRPSQHGSASHPIPQQCWEVCSSHTHHMWTQAHTVIILQSHMCHSSYKL